jgi:hypothetical protein
MKKNTEVLRTLKKLTGLTGCDALHTDVSEGHNASRSWRQYAYHGTSESNGQHYCFVLGSNIGWQTGYAD